jgi:eukaryotic-like serine/threonine-protein kinase
MSAIAVGPAKQLLGKVLAGGWTVVEAIPKNPCSSGGKFSDGYIVESEAGSRAYLKAMDLTLSSGSNDPAGMIHFLTESFLFERNLVEGCRDKKLDRVVTAITSGQVGENPNELVFYLIFELAESDVRSRIGTLRRIDVRWTPSFGQKFVRS